MTPILRLSVGSMLCVIVVLRQGHAFDSRPPAVIVNRNHSCVTSTRFWRRFFDKKWTCLSQRVNLKSFIATLAARRQLLWHKRSSSHSNTRAQWFKSFYSHWIFLIKKIKNDGTTQFYNTFGSKYQRKLF